MTIPNISKTTLSGLLSAVIAVILAISALPPKASAVVVILAICKGVNGYLQTDAPKEPNV